MAEQSSDEPELKEGDTGEGVVLLQVRLFGLGILREVPDGVFNMVTETAVRDLQAQLGQNNDGMVTPQTWDAIRYLEKQAAIQYRYLSPYDALTQINYDLAHPEHGGPYSRFSPYAADGSGQYEGDDQYAQFAGQLSEDGLWRWDGFGWQSAADGTDAYAADGSGLGQPDEYTGRLSDDGLWRWDGTDWQPTDTGGHAQHDGYVGQLSPDGVWRWDGSQWQVA